MRLSVKKEKTCYRPPKGITEVLTAYPTSIFQRVKNEKKESFIFGDFNLNCLNNNKESNVRHFYHKVFELEFIPLIDKPERVCKNSATIIDNILTNCVFDDTLKKADISHHYPISFTIQTGKNQSKYQTFV